MAAVTICSDFGDQENKVFFTVSTVSPWICHEVMGPDAMILVFWMLNFKPTFSFSSLTFIKRLFSSSLSAIRVVSSAYLKVKSESEVTQLCPTLCDPMDCSLPGSSLHGILRQEYSSGLPFPLPGDLPNPRIEPESPALQENTLTSEPPGKPSAYLRLLIFLLVALIPAYASSSLAFFMMYSACKLNKQGDNIQPWCTPFPIWKQSVVPCPVLNVASWAAYRFLRRQIRRFNILIS